MKKFSNPFFHSCEKRGRSIGEGRDFRGGGTLSIVARRDNGRAVLRETPTLARRAHGRAAHTYGTEALSVSTEEVGRAHAHNGGERERGRGAARRFRYRNFRLWQFAVQEVIRSTPTSPYDRIKLG